MEMSYAIFVALAPAIAFAVAGFFIEVVPGFLKWLEAVSQSQTMTEWLKDLVLGATLFGTTASAFLGLNENSVSTLVVSAVWFAIFSTWSYKLSRQLDELKTRDAERDLSKQHRKMAGTVRSIVRGELAKAFQDTEGDQAA